MANDPYWNSVVLAMHMDDTGLTDLKGHAITLNGNAVRSATNGRANFGGYSAYFDGTGDYLRVTVAADLALGTGAFTIEGFVYPTADGTGYLLSIGDGMGTNSFSAMFRSTSQGNVLRFFDYAAATGYAGSVAVTLNAWHHIAFCRSGTTLYGFLDGVKCLEQAGVSTNFNNTAYAAVGGSTGSSVSATSAAYIDDLRLTKGVARYTADFTAPTVAFPNTPPQLSGTVSDASNTLVARTVRAYRRSDGMLTGSATSSAGDGSFSVNAYDASAHYVICLDNGTPDENALIFDNITPV